MSTVRNRAFKDYRNGMKITDIADKYNVPFNTIKSWARRYWKLKPGEKVTSKSHKKVQPRPHGAPKGNQNHFIHGAYVKFTMDSITDYENEYLYYNGFGCGNAPLDKILLCDVQFGRFWALSTHYSKMPPRSISVSALARIEGELSRLQGVRSNILRKAAKKFL